MLTHIFVFHKTFSVNNSKDYPSSLHLKIAALIMVRMCMQAYNIAGMHVVTQTCTYLCIYSSLSMCNTCGFESPLAAEVASGTYNKENSDRHLKMQCDFTQPSEEMKIQCFEVSSAR